MIAARTAALTAAAMAAFAANSLLCRAALAGGRVDPSTFTSLRLAAGAAVLALVARRAPPPEGRAGVAAAALAAYAVLFSLAYTRIPAAVGALALFGAVQVTMVGASIARGDRPRPAEWIGLAVSACGLVGLTLPGLRRPDLAGTALMMLAGAAWAAYSLEARRRGDPVAANADSFLRSVPLVLAVQVAWVVATRRAPDVTPSGAALALVSGAVTSGLGYVIWYAALRGLSATQAAVVQLSVPVLAAAGAVVLLGESLDARLAVSGLAVLGGIGVALAARTRT